MELVVGVCVLVGGLTWGAGGCDLVDLTVGNLLHDWDDSKSSGRLLDLTIADLSGEGRGSTGQSEDDLLEGRHCERDDGINEVWRICGRW